MRFFSIYTLDFFIRLVYVLISYLLCWIIFFNYIEILFLFEVYPLLSVFSTKRFILTHITQLFNTIWFFSLTLSVIFIYPLFVYQSKCFLISGWYYYQIKLYSNLLNRVPFLFVLIYAIIHFYLIPNLLSFFLYWEVSDEYSLLRIEAEISLYLYILWLSTFKFILTFILVTFIKISIVFIYVNNVNYIYLYLLKFKKIFIFIIICLLFVLTPPEFLTQILITFYIYLSVESLFFHSCIKYLIKNAYTKTIIKKTT